MLGELKKDSIPQPYTHSPSPIIHPLIPAHPCHHHAFRDLIRLRKQAKEYDDRAQKAFDVVINHVMRREVYVHSETNNESKVGFLSAGGQREIELVAISAE